MARILVIEDEPDLQQGLSYNLLLAGHVGISALQGNEGLNLAQTQHPGLILPDLSGFEICKTLKAVATTRSIPIVTFTAKKF